MKAAKDNQAAPGATPLVIPNPVELSNTFSQIAKQVEPSVVNISTTYLPKPPRGRRPAAARRQVTPPDDQDQTATTAAWTIFSNASSGTRSAAAAPDMPQRSG